MSTESRHARRFVFYAFSLLALIYLHVFFFARSGQSYIWSRWVPGEETLKVIFVSLEVLAGIGLIVSVVRAWFTLLETKGTASPFAIVLPYIRLVHERGERNAASPYEPAGRADSSRPSPPLRDRS